MLSVEVLSIDANSPEALATFWEAALGWRREDDEDGDEIMLRASDAAAGTMSAMLVIGVPDAKVVKNRLHLDLRPDDQDAEVQRLESLGATRIDIGQTDVTWVVLADPEGNEFCVLRSKPATDAGGGSQG
jgi:predicted enzyme related to lactoylglutathione lyase